MATSDATRAGGYTYRAPRPVVVECGRHQVTLLGTSARCSCGKAPAPFATVFGATLWARQHVEQP
jgi:hypothetical protein